MPFTLTTGPWLDQNADVMHDVRMGRGGGGSGWLFVGAHARARSACAAAFVVGGVYVAYVVYGAQVVFCW